MAPRQDNEINAIWRGDMFPVTYLPVGMSGGVLERGYMASLFYASVDDVNIEEISLNMTLSENGNRKPT